MAFIAGLCLGVGIGMLLTCIISVNNINRCEKALEQAITEKNMYKSLSKFYEKLEAEKSEKLIAIEKELKTNQFNSVINLENKIKTILCTRKANSIVSNKK